MKRRLLLTVSVTALTLSGLCQGTVVFNNRIVGTLVAPVYFDGVLASGNLISAALLAAPGAGAPDSSLMQAQPVTHFRTGTGAGFVVATTATLVNVPKDASVATLRMAVWENLGGIFTTWPMAREAMYAGIIRAGVSEPFNLCCIGGDINTSPSLLGLQGFNVIDMHTFPPPQILAHPQSQLAVKGQTVTFNVVAEGTALSYLWLFNNSIIAGARTPQLTVTNVSAENQGTYRTVVTGYSAGSSVSSNAVLRVISTYPELRAGVGYGGLGPDGFHCTLLSDPGLICGLQRSTNLLNWEAFLSITNTTGEIRLHDAGAASIPYLFYRAVGRLD